MKAVVLLSGGLDSTTTLAVSRDLGFDDTYALTFRYGQRHQYEIDCAQKVAAKYNVLQHVIADINLRMFGGSALTSEIEVPKNRPLEDMSIGIPVTYVPARNTIFLSFALAWADVLDCSDIFIGVNALDYSGYPDCRPEYIAAYQKMAQIATKSGVEGKGLPLQIHAPLISLTKTQIIKRGLQLDVDYSLTSTCYEPVNGQACGVCDACLLRLKGFKELDVKDPIAYVQKASA